MPRYAIQNDDSAIAQIDVKVNLQYRVAFLQPKAELDAVNLNAIPSQLQKHGLIATPITLDGKELLRVRGFKKTDDLFAILKSEKLMPAAANLNREPLEEELHPEVQTFRKYLKEHSIQLAGATYLIADAMPIFSGIVRKTPAEIAQGAMWATTSAALLLFGRKNPEVQMGNIYSRMKDFMAQEGLQLGDDPALALEQLQRDPSYWNGMLNFLYEHPVLFNNTLQGYGGIKQSHAGRDQGNPFKSAAGLSVAVGQWGGLIIPEDKYAGLPPEEKAEKLRLRALGEEPENGFNTKWYENPVTWIHEKPLRLTAIGPIIGNFLSAASALFHDRHEVNKHFGFESSKYELNPATLWRDSKRGTRDLLASAGISKSELKADRLKADWDRQHAQLDKMINTQIGWKFTMMTPIFNIIANTLYGMSSKEERSVNLDKEGYVDELLDVAASIYAHLPKDQRGEKLVRFAGFLKSQPDMHLSEKDIRSRLEAKIEALENSGWMAKIAHQNSSPNASLAL